MTTPTREQVVQLVNSSTMWKPDGLPSDWNDGDYVGDVDDLISLVTLARADLEQQIEFANQQYQDLGEQTHNKLTELEATIAEQAKETAERQADHLKLVEENHELRQQLAAQQAYAEQLRDELDRLCSALNAFDYTTERSRKILSIPHDTYALREYCARVVEKVATMTLSTYALKTIAALIREGTFVPD